MMQMLICITFILFQVFFLIQTSFSFISFYKKILICMLNLVEDRANIKSIFENYLTETKVQDWKYARAIFQLVEIGFDCTAETADLQVLG